MPIRGETPVEIPKADSRDTARETVLVLTFGGGLDRGAEEFLTAYKKGALIEYMSPESLPLQPPAGVKEVYLSSGSDITFYNPQHQSNWNGVSFSRLLHQGDGGQARLSTQEATKRATDFKVLGSE